MTCSLRIVCLHLSYLPTSVVTCITLEHTEPLTSSHSQSSQEYHTVDHAWLQLSKRVPSTVPDTPCFIVHYGDHYSPYIFPSIELKFLHGPDTWHLHSMVIWHHCASVKSKYITISIVSLILFLLRLLNASVLRTLGTSELPRIAECQKHMSSFTEHCIKQKTAPYQHLPL